MNNPTTQSSLPEEPSLTPPTSPASTTSSNLIKRNNLLLAGGIALLLLVCTGTYILGTSKSNSEDVLKKTPRLPTLTPTTIPSPYPTYTPTPSPLPSPTPYVKETITTPNATSYNNQEYKFSFSLQKGELALSCENLLNGSLTITITNKPSCNTDGPDHAIHINKNKSIEQYLENLQKPYNDYKITTSDITISGVKGIKVIGSRNPSKSAPLPNNISQALFIRDNILYNIDQMFLDRDFQFTK